MQVFVPFELPSSGLSNESLPATAAEGWRQLGVKLSLFSTAEVHDGICMVSSRCSPLRAAVAADIICNTNVVALCGKHKATQTLWHVRAEGPTTEQANCCQMPKAGLLQHATVAGAYKPPSSQWRHCSWSASKLALLHAFQFTNGQRL